VVEAKIKQFSHCLCMGISPPPIALESCSNPQKPQQAFASAMKEICWFGVLFFFCEWHYEWRIFKPFWHTSSGPGLFTPCSLCNRNERLAEIRNSHTKTSRSHVALCENFSGPVSTTDPVKGSKDAESLVVYTRKKFFCLGMQIFCECHSS